MRRAALIYNPISGRQRAARRLMPLLKALRGAGYKAEPMPTEGPGDATQLASGAVAGGDLEAVFALGGDGTVRETAAGLVGSRVPLCPLPGGTTNVLVRSLGLPGRALAAARRVGRLVPRDFDVGMCSGQPFLMMASWGLDAHVLTRQNPALKARFGRGSIALQGLREWWRYPYPILEVEADGRKIEASFAAVCNIPLYGGSFPLAPAARFDDGLLNLVVLRGGGRWTTLGFAASVARRSHLRSKGVEHLEVESVVVRGPENLATQVDGDVLPTQLPVSVEVAPGRLRVLAPPV
ncbi:MAG: diacylglycerol kinase family lipid kinase [Acidobacteriota bacterium]|nr:diacylglycerol kinase family lipid kinase [Acidobacteriota bacterium]